MVGCGAAVGPLECPIEGQRAPHGVAAGGGKDPGKGYRGLGLGEEDIEYGADGGRPKCQ